MGFYHKFFRIFPGITRITYKEFYMSGFTGLYTVYRYYSKGIFVFLHREGAYDTEVRRNDRYSGVWYEEICTFRKQTDLVKICLTPSRAKAYVDSLRIKD